MQAYVLGCLVSVVNTTLQFASGQTFANAAEARFAATGFNPNYLASALSLAIPMAWYLATNQRTRSLTTLNYLAIPAILFSIVLTGSRGGFITAALALTVIPLTYRQLRASTQVLLVSTLLALGGLGYWLAPQVQGVIPRGLERISEIPEQLQAADLTGRGDVWVAGWRLFTDHPLIGVGAGGFAAEVKPYLGVSKSAHNAFLNVAVQGGAIAAFLFLTTLAVIAAPYVLNSGGDRIVYAVLLITVLVCLIPSTLETGKEIWITLALAVSRSAFVSGRHLLQRPSAWAAPRHLPLTRNEYGR